MGEVASGRINFAISEDKSASELGGASPLVWNAIPDSRGVMKRRPGIVAWDPFDSSYASGSAVIGMVAFGTGTLVYVTEDRKQHAITTAGGLTELSSSDTATLLDGGGRPCFVPGRNMLAIAGGGAIQKWVGAGLSARLENTEGDDLPPIATSACAIAERLVVQPPGKSGLIWWSGPLEAWENWDLTTEGGAGYLQANARPDPLLWIADNTNEVFTFGTETIQAYTPGALQVDENDPYNLLDFALARTQNIGTRSPYSVVAYDDVFGLIDRRKRAILTDARTHTDIGRQVSNSLRDMERVDNAWGFRMRLGEFDCLVWMFPTDGLGLCWSIDSKTWCEWRQGAAGGDPVTVTSAYDWAEEGLMLVGMSDGTIARLDESAVSDLGTHIKVQIVSGFVDHGTSATKGCRAVSFRFKRTWAELAADASGLSPSGHVRISYRDDQGDWEILEDVELEDDPEPNVIIRSVGVYRTRQWKVEYTGMDQLELVSAEETYELLGV